MGRLYCCELIAKSMDMCKLADMYWETTADHPIIFNNGHSLIFGDS